LNQVSGVSKEAISGISCLSNSVAYIITHSLKFFRLIHLRPVSGRAIVLSLDIAFIIDDDDDQIKFWLFPFLRQSLKRARFSQK